MNRSLSSVSHAGKGRKVGPVWVSRIAEARRVCGAACSVKRGDVREREAWVDQPLRAKAHPILYKRLKVLSRNRW